MPRRSSRNTAPAQTEPAPKGRVTRKAVQEAKPNSTDGKRQSRSRTGSHSPSASSTSSTSSRRAQTSSRGGRGRSRGRGGRGKKAEEPEEEVEEEMEEDASDAEEKAETESTGDQPEAGDAPEVAVETSKKTKKASPAKAKSPRRGRPKGATATPKKTDVTPEKESGETPEKEGSTRRSSRTRSSPRTQQQEPERRRSNRAATIAAAAKPFSDEEGDEEGEEEDMDVEEQPKKSSPRKRKREDEEADETEKSPKKPALEKDETKESEKSPTKPEVEKDKQDDVEAKSEKSPQKSKLEKDEANDGKVGDDPEDAAEEIKSSPQKMNESADDKAPEDDAGDSQAEKQGAAEEVEIEKEVASDKKEPATTSPAKSEKPEEEPDKLPEAASNSSPVVGKAPSVQVDEVESSDAQAEPLDPKATAPDTPPTEKSNEKEVQPEPVSDASDAEEDAVMEEAPAEQTQVEPSSSSSPEKVVSGPAISTPTEPTIASSDAATEANKEESEESVEEAMEVDASIQQNQAVSSSVDVHQAPAAEAVETPTENQMPAADKAEDVAQHIATEQTPEPSLRNEEAAAAAAAAATTTEEPAEDFVMVNKEELPAADSIEVQDSVPSPSAADSSADADHMAATAQLDGPSVHTPLAPTNGCDTENCNSEPSPVSNAQISQSHQPISNNTDNHTSGPLAGRRYTLNPKVDSSAISSTKQFSLVSYNILADCHVQRWRCDYPFAADQELSQEARHELLMQELAELDADVLCLQEVGTLYYKNTLSPGLKLQGYEGGFVRRVGEDFEEGSATFVKSSRFSLLDSHGLVLQDIATKEMKAGGVEENVQPAVEMAIASPAVALLTQLRCVHTEATVSIANIHVAFENFERPDQKSIQVATAIRELVCAAGGADKPHIICGDFNSTPDSPVYQLTQEGYLNDTSMTRLQEVTTVTQPDGQKSSLVNLWWKGFQHTSNNLRSVYSTVFGTEPLSSKFPHDGALRAVDFVWYSSSSLQLLGALEAPEASSLQPGVPSTSFPSDHISTKANLAFL